MSPISHTEGPSQGNLICWPLVLKHDTWRVVPSHDFDNNTTTKPRPALPHPTQRNQGIQPTNHKT